MTSLTVLALPASHAVPSFNGLFYATAATIIPLLFVAIAIEGHFIQDLLRAFSWATGAAVSVLLVLAVRGIFKPKSRLTNNRAFAKTQIYAVTLVAFSPAFLAVSIVGYAAASEIIAILALYWQNAATWMATFVLAGTIFLIVTVGAGPAVAIIRFLIAQARDDTPVNAAPASRPPPSKPDAG
jgi:hypothetical protein